MVTRTQQLNSYLHTVDYFPIPAHLQVLYSLHISYQKVDGKKWTHTGS